MKLTRLFLALALLLTSLALTGLAATPASAATYKGKLKATIGKLRVANENGGGYDRDSFKHWVDKDGDSCDAREEVLIAEAKVKPTVGSDCSLSGGKWVSYYDGVKTTDPSTFDIDHMVPLAEAWASGARTWNAATREAYANDLGDKRALVAVSASSNRSKSDRDPAEWMPAKAKCRYIAEWVAIKVRWNLTVDSKEKKALKRLAKPCKDVTLKVVKAKIVKGNDAPAASGSSTGLRVKSIAYDPPGTDTLNGEYVTLTNSLTSSINLSGWLIKDEAGASYTFPSVNLAPGAELKLYTGSGSNTSSSLFAGKGSAWWNNSGDTFYLYNPTSSLKQVDSYTGTGDGGVAAF